MFNPLRNIVGGVAFASLACIASASAATIQVGNPNDLTGVSLGNFDPIVTFDDLALLPGTPPGTQVYPNFVRNGATFSGGIISNTSVSGLYAQPFGDATQFMTVTPNPPGSNFATITLNGDYARFGLFWGSMDAYNYIQFKNNGVVVDTVTGTQVAQPPSGANGNQVSTDTNRYILMTNIAGGVFDEVILGSCYLSGAGCVNAFEFDNVSWGPENAAPPQVPLPAALPLFATGLGVMGLLGWRRKRSTATAAI